MLETPYIEKMPRLLYLLNVGNASFMAILSQLGLGLGLGLGLE